MVTDRAPDRGAVTVEAAIALSAFVAVLGLVLGAVSAVADQLRCTDAAREAARLVARGEQDRARAVAERIAPDRARVSIITDADTIEVTVHAEPVGGLLPGITLRGEAYAVAEPTAVPDADHPGGPG